MCRNWQSGANDSLQAHYAIGLFSSHAKCARRSLGRARATQSHRSRNALSADGRPAFAVLLRMTSICVLSLVGTPWRSSNARFRATWRCVVCAHATVTVSAGEKPAGSSVFGLFNFQTLAADLATYTPELMAQRYLEVVLPASTL